jgi:hypothetical protein
LYSALTETNKRAADQPPPITGKRCLSMFPPKLSLVPIPQKDQSAIVPLEVVGEQELPDARLTAADRRFVRRVLMVAEMVLSDEGLMFLAEGAEEAAWRKRDGKEASGR